jgi:hypothetical protein
MSGLSFYPRKNCSSTHLFGFEGTPEKKLKAVEKRGVLPRPELDH